MASLTERIEEKRLAEEKERRWREFERRYLSEPAPRVKPKPKPKVQVTTEVSAKVAEAIKANPATLQVRVSAGAQDGTTVIERPRRIEVVEVTAVDGEGRPSLGRRHDLATNEWTTVEFDQGYRRTGVQCDYNPPDGLTRKD